MVAGGVRTGERRWRRVESELGCVELQTLWDNHVEMSSRLLSSQFWAQKKSLGRKQRFRLQIYGGREIIICIDY